MGGQAQGGKPSERRSGVEGKSGESKRLESSGPGGAVNVPRKVGMGGQAQGGKPSERGSGGARESVEGKGGNEGKMWKAGTRFTSRGIASGGAGVVETGRFVRGVRGGCFVLGDALRGLQQEVANHHAVGRRRGVVNREERPSARSVGGCFWWVGWRLLFGATEGARVMRRSVPRGMSREEKTIGEGEGSTGARAGGPWKWRALGETGREGGEACGVEPTFFELADDARTSCFLVPEKIPAHHKTRAGRGKWRRGGRQAQAPPTSGPAVQQAPITGGGGAAGCVRKCGKRGRA